VKSHKDGPAHLESAVGDRILRFLTRLGPTEPLEGVSWSRLFASLDQLSITRLGLVAVLSALCGTSVLYLLNTESTLVEDGDYSVLTALSFIALLMIYRLSQRHLIFRASNAIEAALHDWRQRIAQKVLRLSLRDIEDITPGKLIDGIARHYAPLSQSIVTLAAGVEAAVLLLFMFVYLAFLSFPAAILTAFVGLLCVVAYMNVAAELGQTMTEIANLNGKLDRLSESSIRGSKELRLSGEKRREILEDMVLTSSELYQSRSRSASIFAEVISSGNTASFLMAGSVVFVLPLTNIVEDGSIAKIVMAVIFLIGPIGGVIGSVQQLSIARFSVNSILGFEGQVDAMLAKGGTEPDPGASNDFEMLELEHVDYEHRHPRDIEIPFCIRDVSLQVRRGQVVFITGGNGSGKTTALRVLTGLYPRTTGDIRVDGESIEKQPGQRYRNLFSTVFSDFHVFERVYALDETGMERLSWWLEKLNIRSKLPPILDQGFDPESLSTGQRKRLALALALAEDRPILVLDEWAADQDPATRNRFYTGIVPELKNAGKTIFVVTHDEQYFPGADFHVHMEDGRLTVLKQPVEATP